MSWSRHNHNQRQRAGSGPDFSDHAAAGRKLAIICSKGNLDMAYPGLVLANAALGEGVETHLFFTSWGFDMITKSRNDEQTGRATVAWQT